MTPSEILERFEELPARVQVAVVSHLHGFRSRNRIQYAYYPPEVAEYIRATGFMYVSISDTGGVIFAATEVTRTMQVNIGVLLVAMGRLEAEMPMK